jgi:hypothetical protein
LPFGHSSFGSRLAGDPSQFVILRIGAQRNS